MKDNVTVSTRKIMFTDYLSFILFLLSVAATIFIVTIPLLLILIPLLLRRVNMIKRILTEGERATGMIAGKLYVRGEWIVHYVFRDAAGEAYKVRNAVLGFKLPVDKQQVVSVAYDKADPTKAFLPIIYELSDKLTMKESEKLSE